jgi:hypothetical protein
MTDKTEEDEVYIGCMTVQMGLWNPSSIVDGCVVKQCGTCGNDIHLSPSSQTFLAENPKANLICIPCVQKKTIEDPTKVAPVPGSVPEALDHIARQKRDKT